MDIPLFLDLSDRDQLDNISVITIRLGGIYGAGRHIKKSIQPRRLVSHKDAIKHIANSIYRIGEDDCIDGFSRIVI